jgi:pyrroloquinoline quinone biosynthesis protein D
MTNSTATAATASAAFALTDLPRVRAPFRLQWEPAQEAWVLLYPEGMVKLNRSAGEIMRLCDGVRSVSEVVEELQRLFNVPSLIAEVQAFMAMAVQQGWLQLTPQAAP